MSPMLIAAETPVYKTVLDAIQPLFGRNLFFGSEFDGQVDHKVRLWGAYQVDKANELAATLNFKARIRTCLIAFI